MSNDHGDYMATFGNGQLFHRHYVEIYAPSLLAAEKIMYDGFGTHWSLVYTWDDAGAEAIRTTHKYKKLCTVIFNDLTASEVILEGE